jgi:hypothetical protein
MCDLLDDAREAFDAEHAERWNEFIKSDEVTELWEAIEAEAWEDFLNDWEREH